MRICPACRKQNDLDDLFCSECGTPLPLPAAPQSSPAPVVRPAPVRRPCPRCAHPNDLDDAFCAECGAPLHAVPPPVTSPAAATPPVYASAPVEAAPAKKRALPRWTIVAAAAVVLLVGVAIALVTLLRPGAGAVDQAYMDYIVGRYDEAIAGFEQIRVTQPDDTQLLEALADCYLKTDQEQLAFEVLTRLDELEGTDNVRALYEPLADRAELW